MSRLSTLLALFAVVGLTACKDDENDTGDTDTDSDTTACTNSVVMFPADGATGVYYRTPVEAEFDDMEDGATIALTDGAGADVAGTSAWRGDTLVFTPTAPLAPNASYTASVTYSCGSPSVAWQTGEVGESTDEAGLVGTTWSLDLTSGRFLEPPGVGSILQQYIGGQVILLGATEADGSSIQMIGAMGVENSNPPVQACEPVIPFPTADFTANPYFEVGPETTTLEVEGYVITIEDLFVSGSFAPDGSYIDGATLAGTVDTRPFDSLLDPEATEPGAVCEMAGAIGVVCEPCPSDNEPYCLSLLVDSIQAVEVAGMTLAEDYCDLAECSAEPECAAE